MKSFSGLDVKPLKLGAGLRMLACNAIKQAITEMDIYGHAGEIWLDERQLSADLGVSRTPVREALGFLEQEGLIRSVPRRGAYVVRKTKREIVELITVWAAMESMAARLVAERATAEELQKLRDLVSAFKDDPSTHISEYSQVNMAFHQAIIRAGGCALMTELTASIFVHMRAVRAVTMKQDNRAARSILEHKNIIDALERRDADLAERLVREHTLGLAAHVEKYGDEIDAMSRPEAAEEVPPPRPRGTSARRAAKPGGAAAREENTGKPKRSLQLS